MKISDVLWKAAQNLPDYQGGYNEPSPYTCDQINAACIGEDYWMRSHARDFCRSLGVNTGGYHEFDEFSQGRQRQQARYNWLMFAYEIALEEGL